MSTWETIETRWKEADSSLSFKDGEIYRNQQVHFLAYLSQNRDADYSKLELKWIGKELKRPRRHATPHALYILFFPFPFLLSPICGSSQFSIEDWTTKKKVELSTQSNTWARTGDSLQKLYTIDNNWKWQLLEISKKKNFMQFLFINFIPNPTITCIFIFGVDPGARDLVHIYLRLDRQRTQTLQLSCCIQQLYIHILTLYIFFQNYQEPSSHFSNKNERKITNHFN